MEKIIEVFMYFIPAVIVLLTAFLLLKKFLENDYKLRLLEAKKNIQKDAVLIRLQAYERICIFLERISPNSLILRIHKMGMTARELQSELLAAIRSEYEHNLSQQLYVSSQAWELVKNAKEDTSRMVNTASTLIGEKATGLDLSKAVFELIIKNETIPNQKALDFIKNEVRQLFWQHIEHGGHGYDGLILI